MMRIVDIISTIPLDAVRHPDYGPCWASGLQSIIIALGSVVLGRYGPGGPGAGAQPEGSRNLSWRPGPSALPRKTILLEHLIPNAMGSILVTVTMLIPSAIFMEAFLSYLGIGLKPPLASLGTMCNDATENLRSCPHQLFIPALVICIIMFAFNFVGDGLRDALDPKLKK